MDKKTLYIIDFFNLLFRMYYAVPAMQTKTGLQVNAAFGVIRFLLQLLQKQECTHLVLACDSGSQTFRTDMYEAYKSNRDRMPDELSTQLDIVWKFLELVDLPRETLPGFEADDIIGTLATKYAATDEVDEVVIISSDKDLFQFIDGKKVYVYDGMKKRRYGLEGAREKFGVDPEYIVDYLAIVGDTSDCIPGVKGIGPKGAVKLIEQYGGVEQIYSHIDEISGRTQTLLIESQDLAFMSKKLATIDCDVSLEHDISHYRVISLDEIFSDNLVQFLYDNEFRSLVPSEYEQIQYIPKDVTLTDIHTQSEWGGVLHVVSQCDEILVTTT